MFIEALLKTYNRAEVLPNAIKSYLEATLPKNVRTRLTIIDNNSCDNTRAVVESFVSRFPGRVHYVFASVQGPANALHAGVSQSNADVLAMFDDDEEIQKDWLEVIAFNFRDPTLDYIGGEMRPNWLVPAPEWLPDGFKGAVGIVHNGDQRRQYGSLGFKAMLVGGNMAIRRSVLSRCKPWSECNLPHAEDRFMFNEFQRIGAVGFYEPALVVMHQVPAKRVSNQYQRFWATLEGRTNARIDHQSRVESRSLLGIPLWRWSRATKGLFNLAIRRGDASARMQEEMQLREFWGYLTLTAGWVKEDPIYRSKLS